MPRKGIFRRIGRRLRKVPRGVGAIHFRVSVTVCCFASFGTRTCVTAPNLSVVENQPASLDERKALSEENRCSFIPSLTAPWLA